MFLSVEEICGCEVCCSDGVMGKVQDVILSRSVWRMRYAVVDLGPEIGNARVLLPLADSEHVDASRRRLVTSLTCRELEWAAPHDAARPLTRRQERFFSQRYGWPAEWLEDATDGAAVMTTTLELEKPVTDLEQELEQMLSDGPETQSAQKMLALFTASTRDRRTASIETLIVDTEDWGVPYLALQLGSARPVVVPAHHIQGIDWLHKHVYFAETADRIGRCPRYTSQIAARMALMQRLGAFYSPSGTPDAQHEPIPDNRLAGVSCNPI